MPKNYIELLKHILDECNFITSSLPPSATKPDLVENEVLKRAVVRSLEIIGEATKKIPVDVKMKWKDIEWKNMAGMRDKLIHDYFGINYSIVWDVIINKIPTLKIQIEMVIKENN